MTTRRALLATPMLLLCALAGCAGPQNPLDPAGPQAQHVDGLWWLYFWICAFVFFAVSAFTLIALARRRDADDTIEIVPTAGRERRAGMVASAAVVLTVLLLVVLIAGDLVVGRSLQDMETARDSLPVKIIGHQWWWEVEYRDGGPDQMVRTANEIKIPVGRPIRFELSSNDVIHSFWIPNLHGKKDLIPGRPTSITMRADREGSFTGQCAEYCGHQHAHMRFTVAAVSPEAFDDWLAHQRQPAPEPRSESELRGREVFLTGTCVMCHTIMGTPAGSRMGPDLTHVASRPSIAGGTLPNTRGNLAGWILDPQHIKPGVRMPNQTLPAADLHALLDYLESLK